MKKGFQFWLKVIIAVLSALAGAVGGASLSVCALPYVLM
ncbi:smalltalk protein [Bacteroides pyogenes]